MEFNVSRNELFQALKHCQNAICKGPLGIFKNFVFTFSEEPKPLYIKIHASNGEYWITEMVPIISVMSSADAPGPFRTFAVYCYDILRAVMSLEEQPLIIRVHEYQLSVHHARGFFRIPLAKDAEAKEFLEWKRPGTSLDNGPIHHLVYEVPCLRSILSRCKYAMAQDELRPVMNGVHFNLTDKFSDYVSSDGHKLVRVRKDPMNVVNSDGPMSFIIPAQIVRVLMKILPTTGFVGCVYQEESKKERASMQIIMDDNISLSFRPVDGKYPKYWNVIPEQFNYELTVKRRLMIKCVERLAMFANWSSGLMMMRFDKKDVMYLNVEDKDYEMSGEEFLECDFAKTGKGALNFRIGVKASSVAETLRALSSEDVVFRFIDSSHAIIITPKPQPDVEEVTMLLMPMLCND